jgi:hypothetical protein
MTRDKSRIGTTVGRVAVLLGSMLLIVATLSAPAYAAKRKDYSATVTSSSTFGGLSTNYVATITNLPSSRQTLGSANVTVPAGFSSIVLGAVTPPPGKTWLPPTLSGSVIQLRNPGPSNTNALSPGQSLSVAFSAVSPCTPLSNYVLATHVKQSNDFSGTGNDFNLVGAAPTISILVGCPDHLAFDQQPTDTIAGQAINSALLPTGVTVRVEDSADQLVTISSASVAIAIGSGPGNLFGTSPVSAVGGIATFTDLAIDTSGTYTLVASSTPLTPATSASFDISGVASKCDQSPCGVATGLHATQDDVTVGTASVPVGPCVGVCFVSIDEGTGDFCGGTCTGNTIIFAPPANQDDIATITIEIFKSLLPGNLSSVRVFKFADGVTTELFDCPSPDPTVGVPCVADRSHVAGGNGLFTILLGVGDPFLGTH